MLMQLATLLCAIQMLIGDCKCTKFIDLSSDSDNPETHTINESIETVSPYPPVRTSMKAITYPPTKQPLKEMPHPPVKPTIKAMTYTTPVKQAGDGRRLMQNKYGGILRQDPDVPSTMAEDTNLKTKIGFLIEQTIHDTQKRIKSIQRLKEEAREEGPYKVGFLLSLIKRSRTVLNDLFNLSIKHRDNWKALEQLKIFEFIVHVNVDTTNLIRQLVEVHLQNLTPHSDRRKVVLI